jgi:hypothetical protein
MERESLSEIRLTSTTVTVFPRNWVEGCGRVRIITTKDEEQAIELGMAD